MVRMGNDPDVGDVPFLINDTIWQYFNPVLCATGTSSEAIGQNPEGTTLWPNPANQSVVLNGDRLGFAYSIADGSGRVLMQGRSITAQITVSLTDFVPGIYSVTIVSNHRSTVSRLVVQK